MVLSLSFAFSVACVYATPTGTGFKYYLQIIIDADDIDETLTNFPVLVHLSSSCGVNNFDASEIFNEIGDNYNYTAYSDSEGERLYFEIDTWNATAQEAYVWVKLSEISNTSDTVFYFWFEKFKDGSSYNIPANIWDSNYVMVHHMNDATTSTILDSTSNDNDGTKTGVNEPIESFGQIGKAQDYAGDDDYINISTPPYPNDSNNITITGWFKVEGGTNTRRFIFETTPSYSMSIEVYSDNKIRCYTLDEDATISGNSPNFTPIENTTYFFCLRRIRGIEFNLFINTTEYVGDVPADKEIQDVTGINLGTYRNANDRYFNGVEDEITVSNIDRSDSWIVTTYKTQGDDLNIFGTILEYNTTISSLTFGVLGFIFALFALIIVLTVKK